MVLADTETAVNIVSILLLPYSTLTDVLGVYHLGLVVKRFVLIRRLVVSVISRLASKPGVVHADVGMNHRS